MHRGRIIIIILCSLLISCSVSKNERKSLTISETRYVNDDSRNRVIPIEIYSPLFKKQLNNELVILSAGYWCVNTGYSYISKRLSEKGYLVVALQHELETDIMLASGKDMYKLRLPNWKEGVNSIQVVLKYLKKEYPNMSFDKLNLIGHSNGGDISMLFATEFPENVRSCITLDHRRMPIPRTDKVKIMTIRADEYSADNGVIPSVSELEKYKIEIVNLKNVGHNYLRDNATKQTKEIIINRIEKFVSSQISKAEHMEYVGSQFLELRDHVTLQCN